MSLLLKLKEKLSNIIDDINTGSCDLSCNDISTIIDTIRKLSNKKLYRADIAEKFDVDIDDGVDKLIYTGVITLPYYDEDGNEFWWSSELKLF